MGKWGQLCLELIEPSKSQCSLEKVLCLKKNPKQLLELLELCILSICSVFSVDDKMSFGKTFGYLRLFA